MFKIGRRLFLCVLINGASMQASIVQTPSQPAPQAPPSAQDLLYKNKYRLNRSESSWNVGQYQVFDPQTQKNIYLDQDENLTPERLLELKPLMLEQGAEQLKTIDLQKVNRYLQKLNICVNTNMHNAETLEKLNTRIAQMTILRSMIHEAMQQ